MRRGSEAERVFSMPPEKFLRFSFLLDFDPSLPRRRRQKNSKPSNNQGAIDAVAGPALSGEIQCFVGPAGTVVGLRYGSAQVS